jgi:hypothetical protein
MALCAHRSLPAITISPLNLRQRVMVRGLWMPMCFLRRASVRFLILRSWPVLTLCGALSAGARLNSACSPPLQSAILCSKSHVVLLCGGCPYAVGGLVVAVAIFTLKRVTR